MNAILLIPGVKTALMYVLAAAVAVLFIVGFSFKNDVKEFLGIETTSSLKVKLADQVNATETAVDANKSMVATVEAVKKDKAVSEKTQLDRYNQGMKVAKATTKAKLELATTTEAAADQVATLELKFDRDIRIAQDNLSTLVIEQIQVAYDNIEHSTDPA